MKSGDTEFALIVIACRKFKLTSLLNIFISLLKLEILYHLRSIASCDTDGVGIIATNVLILIIV